VRRAANGALGLAGPGDVGAVLPALCDAASPVRELNVPSRRWLNAGPVAPPALLRVVERKHGGGSRIASRS
jgi:hypothetical protein